VYTIGGDTVGGDYVYTIGGYFKRRKRPRIEDKKKGRYLIPSLPCGRFYGRLEVKTEYLSGFEVTDSGKIESIDRALRYFAG
jgi:hypothetical protein